MKTYLLLSGLLMVMVTLVLLGIKGNTAEKLSYEQLLMNEGFLGKYQPVKTFFDENNDRIFWVNMLGELHYINQDMQNHQLISNKGTGWKDVTYIEDFCLSRQYDSIYFTDIMDLQTGMSALKVTDIAGKEVKVLRYLRREIPYAIRLLNDSKLLFFLSNTEKAGRNQYRLRFIDLNDGSMGMLYTSDHKIKNLEVRAAENVVVAQDSRQQLISFSTEAGQFNNLSLFDQ